MIISGSIYNSMKLMKLGIKWQERKANPTKPREDEDPQQAQMERHLREQMERTQQTNVMLSLEGKLRAGQELSPEELEYLKNNHPELYEEAMEIKRERQAYKEALRKCRTREDVERLNLNKMNQFISQAKAVSSNPNLPKNEKKAQLDKILKRVMGVRSEHLKFLQTREYQELPTEQEVREDKARKKHRPGAAPEQLEEEQEELVFSRSRQAVETLADTLTAAFQALEQPDMQDNVEEPHCQGAASGKEPEFSRRLSIQT